MLAGRRGFGGGLGEIMEGGLGFVEKVERRGRDGLVGGRDGGRGGSLKIGVEEGIWGGGGEGGVGEGIGILLVLFLFLFLDLTTTLFGLGWKSGSSGSESFSGEEGGGEGGGRGGGLFVCAITKQTKKTLPIIFYHSYLPLYISLQSNILIQDDFHSNYS